MELSSSLYKKSTFFSLSGASGIVLVTACSIIYVYAPAKDWKILPFLISFIVSFTGLRFVKEELTDGHYVLAFFNSFLIFAQSVGLNVVLHSMPINQYVAFETNQKVSGSKTPAAVGTGDMANEKKQFFQLWYDGK